MQFTPRVCGGIVEGLPRMIIELNRGTPAPVRLSIPSNRAAQKRDYNEIDPSSGTDSSNPPRSTGESVANLTADDLMLNTTGPGSSRDMERSGLRAQLRPNFSGSAINRRSTSPWQGSLWGPTPTRSKLVAFIREPALAIWQATKCLAEIHARTEAPDVSKIIAEAETILLGLMLALVRRSDISGSASALESGKGK
jgi:hypothetical protein